MDTEVIYTILLIAIFLLVFSSISLLVIFYITWVKEEIKLRLKMISSNYQDDQLTRVDDHKIALAYLLALTAILIFIGLCIVFRHLYFALFWSISYLVVISFIGEVSGNLIISAYMRRRNKK